MAAVCLVVFVALALCRRTAHIARVPDPTPPSLLSDHRHRSVCTEASGWQKWLHLPARAWQRTCAFLRGATDEHSSPVAAGGPAAEPGEAATTSQSTTAGVLSRHSPMFIPRYSHRDTSSTATVHTPEWVRAEHKLSAERDAQLRMFERQTLGWPVPLSDVSDAQLASRFVGCSLTMRDKAPQQLSLASIVIGDGRSRCLKFPAGGDPAGGDPAGGGAPEARREHREGADQWRRRCVSLSPQTPLLKAWTTLGVKVRRAACAVLPRRGGMW